MQLVKEKGKKLEARWSTRRILKRISRSGVSGHISQLHDPPGKIKRYYLDVSIPFVPRFEDPVSTVSAIEYTRDVLGDVQGNWVIGQRAFDLTDIGSRESTGWEQMER